jgi:hypothetical protein
VKIKFLVQDIETIPETEIAGEWIKERDELIEGGKKDPFPPIVYHKVITVGMLALDDKLHAIKGGCAAGGLAGGKSEKEMIERWSSVIANEGGAPLRMVDWYGRGFDVPVLQTRAFRYGIPLPWYFGLLPDNKGGRSQWSKEYRDRYQGHHMDLSELWTGKGAFPRPHLAELAKLMGLPGKMDGDGGKVYDTWKNFRHCIHVAEGKQTGPAPTPEQSETWRKKAVELAQEIDTYCMRDVFQTAFIFQRYSYLAGDIDINGYREAARNLLAYVRGFDGKFAERVDQHALLME